MRPQSPIFPLPPDPLQNIFFAMNTDTITLWLEDDQDVDELIDAYLMEHPEHAGRDFFVIDPFSGEDEDEDDNQAD